MKKNGMKKGQGLVEFALILPLLILMGTILFDLGRMVLAYSVLNNAVREGTRDAVVQPKLCICYSMPCPGLTVSGYQTDIEAKIRSYFYTMQDINANTTVSFSPAVDSLTGNPITVCAPTDPFIHITIQYVFHPVTPGLQFFLGSGNTPTLTVQSTMYLTPYSSQPTPSP